MHTSKNRHPNSVFIEMTDNYDATENEQRTSSANELKLFDQICTFVCFLRVNAFMYALC
jgi:hypothetical protein